MFKYVLLVLHWARVQRGSSRRAPGLYIPGNECAYFFAFQKWLYEMGKFAVAISSRQDQPFCFVTAG
jgi:hypothetical protein